MAELIRATESLCPICLEVVPARLLGDGQDVFLEGRCPAHGSWQTLIWAGPPSFDSWCGPDSLPAARQVCTVVMEVTHDCDLGCPFCFAESSPGRQAGGSPDDYPGVSSRDSSEGYSEPPLAQIVEHLKRLFASEGAVNLQLSGGEPTMRSDLPQIIEAACTIGFTFVQLNTNGIRLATKDGYAERLREAGLKSVFLQFDGLTDDTHRALRGHHLARAKMRAVERCAEAGLAVVLVPTVVPGINDGELGAMVRFAASWPGVVRGLHLQPVSYFGRYQQNGRLRLTLPEVIRALEEQTGGEVRADDFRPSCCEHARCSFRARYWVRDEGRLELLGLAPCACGPDSGGAPRRAVAATARQWSRQERKAGRSADAVDCDGLGGFLVEADRILAISGMLFQDAWNTDMERIRRCCVQVMNERGGLVPFCLWNVTSESGQRLQF